MDAPEGLAERGARLWAEVTAGRTLNPASAVLLGEACRAIDRLDKLDGLLRGEVATWVSVYEPPQGGDLELIIDRAAAEARQLQTALTGMLKQLGVGKGAAKTEGSSVDALAARRARRRAAAESS